MKRYVAAFYRRKWLYMFVLLLMLGALGAAAWEYALGYQSESRLWIDRPTIDRLLERDRDQYQTGFQEQTVSEYYSSVLSSLIQTDVFIQQALEGTALGEQLDGTPDNDRPILDDVRAGLSQESVGPNSIQITYFSDDPELSEQIANNVTEEFRSWVASIRTDETAMERQFYEERVETYEEQVTAIEQQVEELRAENPEGEGAAGFQLERMERELETARDQLREAQQDATDAQILDSLAASYSESELRVVDSAQAPASPSADPRQLLTLLIPGVVAAFGLVFLAVVLVVWQDRTVRSPQDLQDVTAAPVLASIPRMRKRDHRTMHAGRAQQRERPGGLAERTGD